GVSRAVRTPSRPSTDLRVTLAGLPAAPGANAFLVLLGDPAFRTQGVVAYEIGYRVQPRASLYVDLTAYHNRYDHLTTQEPGAPFLETEPAPAHVVVPLRFANLAHGQALGAEAFASWAATRRLKLVGGYSWIDLR